MPMHRETTSKRVIAEISGHVSGGSAVAGTSGCLPTGKNALCSARSENAPVMMIPSRHHRHQPWDTTATVR